MPAEGPSATDRVAPVTPKVTRARMPRALSSRRDRMRASRRRDRPPEVGMPLAPKWVHDRRPPSDRVNFITPSSKYTQYPFPQLARAQDRPSRWLTRV